jgi:hypothetical protein
MSAAASPRLAITFRSADDSGSSKPSRMNSRQKSFFVEVGLCSSNTEPIPLRACTINSLCSAKSSSRRSTRTFNPRHLVYEKKAKGEIRCKGATNKVRTMEKTYEMNICNVSTDVWHSNWMKFEACNRHSEGYLFEVKPTGVNEIQIAVLTASGHDYAPIITGIPLPRDVSFLRCLDRWRGAAHPIRQNPSKKPASPVTSYQPPKGQHVVQMYRVGKISARRSPD